MSKVEALNSTKQLLELLNEIDGIYEKVRVTKEEHDFKQVVEPYARKVEELTKNWQRQLEKVIKEQQAYFIGERHIDQVVDNTCHLSIQAFYASTSYSRFKSYLQSTKFLLKTMERQLKEM